MYMYIIPMKIKLTNSIKLFIRLNLIYVVLITYLVNCPACTIAACESQMVLHITPLFPC